MRVKNLARTNLAARRAAVRYTVAQRFPGSRKASETFLMDIASDAFIATFTRATHEQRPIRVQMLLATAMGQRNTVSVAHQSLGKAA